MSRTVTIGGTTFGDGPRIAVVLDRPVPFEAVEVLPDAGADLLEIRMDLFAEGPSQAIDYVTQLRRAVTLPLLATLRETDATRGKRVELFRAVVPMVDAVDIEVDADERDQIVALADGKTVIVSEHDFSAMPDDGRLQQILERARACGGHVTKVAGTARSGSDVARLLTFCHCAEAPVIAVAMGEHGAISRVLGPLFGSLFSYTFLSEAVAPGQLGLDELATELERYYPGYRRSGRGR